jgi:hypothetical protein
MSPDNDGELVRRAREAGENSCEYWILHESLRETGVGALMRLLTSNRNSPLAPWQKRNLRMPRAPEDFSTHIRSLVHLAVLSALQRFMRDQVMGSRWKASKGASLRTFFITACMFAFAEEYRKFYSSEVTTNDIPIGQLGDFTDRPGYGSTDPATTVTNRDLIGRLLPPSMDADLREMFLLTAEGYTQQEIAERFGLTAENVST